MSTRAGRVGDLIAAAVIELHGGDAVISRTDCFDILALYATDFFVLRLSRGPNLTRHAAINSSQKKAARAGAG